jgi:zinc transport system substrate-binding protein
VFRILLSAILLALFGTAEAQSPALSPKSNRLVLVTSSAPLQWLLESVAGSRAEVLALVTPGSEPDTFDPSPKDFRRLASAQAYFGLGMRFEQAIQIRLNEINKQMRFVDLRPLAVQSMKIHHSHGADSHEIEDPHYWTNPVNMMRFAAGFRDELLRLMPEHANEFNQNTATVVSSLQTLDQWIRTELKGVRGKELWVFHAAWGYFCAEYGLTQVAIETPNKEKSPKALQELLKRARAQKIKAIFNQPQYSQSNAKFIARQLGAEVVIIDPLSKDYLENMRAVTATIKSSL